MENELTRINYYDLLIGILKHWWFILLITVITCGLTYYIVSTSIAPVYELSTTLFVGKEADGTYELGLGDLQLDNQLVYDYGELVVTDMIIEQAILSLGINISTFEIQQNMEVYYSDASRFIYIIYHDSDPERGVMIVNAISQTLANKAFEIVGIKNIQIVDYAKVPSTPIKPNKVLIVAASGLAAIFVSAFIVCIKTILSNSVIGEDVVEKEIGLPVLGSIPKLREGNI